MTPSRFKPMLVREQLKTVRMRLTATYAGLFLVCGVVLVALSYGLVARSISTSPKFALELPAAIHPSSGVRSDVVRPAGVGIAVPNGTQSEVEHQASRYASQLRTSVKTSLLRQSAIALGACTIAAILFGWILAGRALRRLRTVTSTARELSHADLHRRLNLPGPKDEIKELGDTFDRMLARLEDAFGAQKRFAANASHELRTPLAVQRSLLDVVGSRLREPRARQMVDQLKTSVDRNEQMVEALLMLANSDTGRLSWSPVDISAITRQAIDLHGAHATESGPDFTAQLSRTELFGDNHLIRRMVENLIHNAIVHSAPDAEGRCWATVTTLEQADSWILLRLDNSTDLHRAAAAHQLFEPFVRDSSDRTGSSRGTGLGLSIVRSIAVAHGGSAELSTAQPGVFRVDVRLPADGRSKLAEDGTSVADDSRRHRIFRRRTAISEETIRPACRSPRA